MAGEYGLEMAYEPQAQGTRSATDLSWTKGMRDAVVREEGGFGVKVGGRWCVDGYLSEGEKAEA